MEMNTLSAPTLKMTGTQFLLANFVFEVLSLDFPKNQATRSFREAFEPRVHTRAWKLSASFFQSLVTVQPQVKNGVANKTIILVVYFHFYTEK